MLDFADAYLMQVSSFSFVLQLSRLKLMYLKYPYYQMFQKHALIFRDIGSVEFVAIVNEDKYKSLMS